MLNEAGQITLSGDAEDKFIALVKEYYFSCSHSHDDLAGQVKKLSAELTLKQYAQQLSLSWGDFCAYYNQSIGLLMKHNIIKVELVDIQVVRDRLSKELADKEIKQIENLKSGIIECNQIEKGFNS